MILGLTAMMLESILPLGSRKFLPQVVGGRRKSCLRQTPSTSAATKALIC